MITKFLSMLMVWTLAISAAQVTKNGPEGDCGFSKLRTRHISDFKAINTVMPLYPTAAEAKRLSGSVHVRVLINKQGQVERTCPVYVVGEPRPDRSLVVAAEAAALQWSFHPNFGFVPANAIRFDYVQDVIVFKFVPMEREKGQSKHQ